jgi:hypothetical protein
VERRVITVTEIFVFKRFQPVLFGLFKFDPEMILSVIDPINLRYRDVITAKKGTCEPVPNNLVTANKISTHRQHRDPSSSVVARCEPDIPYPIDYRWAFITASSSVRVRFRPPRRNRA